MVDMQNKRSIGYIKRNLTEEYLVWCRKRDIPLYVFGNYFEFLMQKGFIRGKKWKEYVAGLPVETYKELTSLSFEPLLEGMYPPDAKMP